jgi:hypothetical protein
VAKSLDYPGVLLAVARDIEKLKLDFPQLQDFSAAGHAQAEALQISYAFHTHRPQGRAGWTSGVPNPDDDAIWFYLDFHDKNSMAQIHTQPVVPMGKLGQKRVMLLILEGAETKAVAAQIWGILRRHQVSGIAP